MKDYRESEFGPDGLLKRYSADYNNRRKNGKTIDLENQYPDFFTEFEFFSFVIDKNLEHIDHDIPNEKYFDIVIDEAKRVYSFLNCKGKSVISPTMILESVMF